MIIPVELNEKSYGIVVEKGSLNSINRYINTNRKVLIVTDSGVPEKYVKTVKGQCRDAVVFSFEQGEQSKNFSTFQNILSTMVENSFTRNDCVIALGGGVVGDISGFAASCYMRGIDFFNIPTTLLSQVDSSIGGKTAIDFLGYKNIVGAFYQPKYVIIDPCTLSTLDKRQFNSGLCEAIKMALTCNRELFESIESSHDIETDIEKIIIESIKIKKSVVEQDEKESGLRRVLNFGHTIGHAIESFEQGKLLHGECVALGMIPMCEYNVRIRLINLLEKLGIPTKINQSKDELYPYLIHDKKMQSDTVFAVFVNEIGTFKIKKIKPSELLNRLEDLI